MSMNLQLRNASFALSLSLCSLAMSGEAVGGDAIVLPSGAMIPRDKVDFERHIAGLLSRHGCNSAACHGSSEGRGGLQLSLFGYSPRMDFESLTAADSGRVDVADPQSSLLLVKPTGKDEHGGGLRFEPASWQHDLIEAWIENGAEWTRDSGDVKRLEVAPSQVFVNSKGDTESLKVTATFADESRLDVTSLCTFAIKDPSIAEINALGQVRTIRGGDTAVIVTYRDTICSIPLLVPLQTVLYEDAEFPKEVNFVDNYVFAKLRRLGISPSGPTSDAEFLRRVTLDVIGALPEPDDVRRFLSNDNAQKREKEIDALLHHPMRAALWATRMCDVTGCDVRSMEGPDKLRSRRANMWHDWFRKRFQQNMPYHEIVAGILCATSRDGASIEDWIKEETQLLQTAENGFETGYADRSSLDLYWRRVGPNSVYPLEDLVERSSAAFLGVRIGCARCHKHPFDRWTQNDYNSFANIFAPVHFDSSPELRLAIAELLDQRREAKHNGRNLPTLPRLSEVYISSHGRRFSDTESKQPIASRALGGEPFAPSTDPRGQLLGWLTQRDNPYFAHNFVNRVWRYYFGRGLVDPVDDFSSANPPSHPALLDELAKEFVVSGYDIRHIERFILASATYQLSSEATAFNRTDERNYSHALIRPVMAEVAIDAINQALGTHEEFGADVPEDCLAIEVAPNVLADPSMHEMMKTFGRGDRASTCDCDRADAPSLRQSLYRMSNERLVRKLSTGRLQALLDYGVSDKAIIEEFYLASLSRVPTDAEFALLRDHIAGGENRQERLIDIVWALINSREFVTNH